MAATAVVTAVATVDRPTARRRRLMAPRRMARLRVTPAVMQAPRRLVPLTVRRLTALQPRPMVLRLTVLQRVIRVETRVRQPPRLTPLLAIPDLVAYLLPMQRDSQVKARLILLLSGLRPMLAISGQRRRKRLAALEYLRRMTQPPHSTPPSTKPDSADLE
jgi:hypothetical protein